MDSLIRPPVDRTPRRVASSDGKPLSIVRRLLHRKDSSDAAGSGPPGSSFSAKPSVIERLEGFFAQDLPSSMEVLPARIPEEVPAASRLHRETAEQPRIEGPEPGVKEQEGKESMDNGSAPSAFSSVRLVRQAAKDAVARFQAAYEEIDANLKNYALEFERRQGALFSSAETVSTNLQQLQAKLTKDLTDELAKMAQPLIVRSAQQLDERSVASVAALHDKLEAEKQRFIEETEKQFETLRASRQAFIDDSQKQLAAATEASLDSLTKAAVEKAGAELDASRQALINETQTQMTLTCRSSIDLLRKELTEELNSKASAELSTSQQSLVEETQGRMDKMVQASIEQMQSLAAASVEQASTRLVASHQQFMDEARGGLASLIHASLQSEIKNAVERGRKELGNMVDDFLAKAVPQIEAELQKLVSRRTEAIRAEVALSLPASARTTPAAPARTAPPASHSTSSAALAPWRMPASQPSQSLATQPARGTLPRPLSQPAAHPLELRLAESALKPRVDRRDLWTGILSGLKLGMALGVVVPVAFTIYLFTSPVIRLRANPPAAFLDESTGQTAKQQAVESQTAQAYWAVAVNDIETRYGFGSALPADPPDSFKVEEKSPSGVVRVDEAARDRYWEKLREVWSEPDSWERTSNEGVTWARGAWQTASLKVNQLFNSSASAAP